jgi:glutathione S-transferase
MQLTLHSAWRSSAAYRVRIGLNLKDLAYDTVPVNLVANQHLSPAFAALNPQHLVPALEVDGRILTQSLAILDWLDETVPAAAAAAGRSVRPRLGALHGPDRRQRHPPGEQPAHPAGPDRPGRRRAGPQAWIGRWITDGFTALETMIAQHGRGYAFGDTPTLADCCLIPQVYNAERFKTDLTPFPAIRAVAARCAEHPAFVAAHPNQQPDAIHA